MKRSLLRLTLAALLVALTYLAAAIGFQSYDRSPDPKARYRIESVRLENDRSYRWLEIHLRQRGEETHDMRRPVRLITAKGQQYEPADTTLAGNPESGFTDLWFKFWLETEDLQGKLDLRLNEGTLRVKSNDGPPPASKDEEVIIRSSDWRKSWLGF